MSIEVLEAAYVSPLKWISREIAYHIMIRVHSTVYANAIL